MNELTQANLDLQKKRQEAIQALANKACQDQEAIRRGEKESELDSIINPV